RVDRPAVTRGPVDGDLEDVTHGPVHAQVAGEHTGGTFGRFQHDCAGAVPEEDACGAIGEIDQVMQLLGADNENRLVRAALDHVGADLEPVDEARASGVQVHRCGVPRLQVLLDHARRRRDDRVATAGGYEEEVDVLGGLAGGGEGTVTGNGRQLRGFHMADPPLLDPRPGGDP